MNGPQSLREMLRQGSISLATAGSGSVPFRPLKYQEPISVDSVTFKMCEDRIMAAKPSSSIPKALIIMGTASVFFFVIHWVLLASGASQVIRLIVDLISIAVCGTAVVNFFRVALRASAAETKRNPNPR